MRAKLVVFPLRGRNWCFGRSIDPSSSIAVSSSSSSSSSSTLKDLWHRLSSSKPASHNAELLIDFVSDKMNKAWMGLEKAPHGSFKNKIHGLGLKLLSRVKPSEIFLKSISKDVTALEISHPPSLNARLVRRRLRHVAMRGAVIHRKYFYGSVSLLPLTTAFTVLPLPNIPFFWVLFRTYSHWRALQGSEKLLHLVSDCSPIENSDIQAVKGNEIEGSDFQHNKNNSQGSRWVLQPSKELEKLLQFEDVNNGLSERAISDICKTFNLNTNDILKFRHAL